MRLQARSYTGRRHGTGVPGRRPRDAGLGAILKKTILPLGPLRLLRPLGRLGLLAGLWLGGVFSSAAGEDRWAVVEQGPFEVVLVESGEIAAVEQVHISAPRIWSQSLQITGLVPEGTRVEAGDFLVQFDDRESRAALDQAQDALLSLEADLAELQARQRLRMANLRNDQEFARYSLEQAQLRLESSRFESKARQEIVRLQLRQAEIRLARVATELESQEVIHRSELIKLETRIAEARGRVDRHRDQLDALRVTAPIGGLVVYKDVGRWGSRERLRTGYTAFPSEGLLAIPDLDRMEAQLSVNELDWPQLRVGQPARVSLDAYPEVELSGRVAEVGKITQASPFPNSPPGFAVVVSIERTDPKLKPGMTARVEILLEEVPGAMWVPAGTVFEVSGQPVVFPRGEDRGLAVELGERADGRIVIRRGVRPGMELSWTPVGEGVFPLGAERERERLLAARTMIAEDLEILAGRGLLFDYGRGAGQAPRHEDGEETRSRERPPGRRGAGRGEGGRRGGGRLGGERPQGGEGPPEGQRPEGGGGASGSEDAGARKRGKNLPPPPPPSP